MYFVSCEFYWNAFLYFSTDAIRRPDIEQVKPPTHSVHNSYDEEKPASLYDGSNLGVSQKK